MTAVMRWRRRLGALLVSTGLIAGPGCLSCCHPVDPPSPGALESCHAVPPCCRSHIYIFLINGIDPVHYVNLLGVRTYLVNVGFIKTYHGELYHVIHFNHEIRRLHKDDPDARFVLVGHGLGANLAESIARDVQDENIHIDLLVYLDGNMLSNKHDEQPANVARVVNILADHGCFWSGEDLNGAQNAHLGDGSHCGAPTHPETLDRLTQELIQIAATVPKTTHELVPTKDPAPETAPPPRTLPARSMTRDQWDYLKPADSLSSQSPVQYPLPEVVKGAPPAPASGAHSVLKPDVP